MMEVQVYAPFHLAQLVLPSMRQRRQGWIVNISSGAGIHPKPPYPARAGAARSTAVCKRALERFHTASPRRSMTIALRSTWSSPGLVDTPGVAVQHD